MTVTASSPGDLTIRPERVSPRTAASLGQTIRYLGQKKDKTARLRHASSLRFSEQKNIPELQDLRCQSSPISTPIPKVRGISNESRLLCGVFLLEKKITGKRERQRKSTGSKTTLSCSIYIHVILNTKIKVDRPSSPGGPGQAPVSSRDWLCLGGIPSHRAQGCPPSTQFHQGREGAQDDVHPATHGPRVRVQLSGSFEIKCTFTKR